MKRFLIILGATISLTVACCVGCDKGDKGDSPSANEQGAAEKSSIAVGTAALEAGEWTRAFDAFSDALAADPNAVDAYCGRAAASLALAKERYQLAKAAATNNDIEAGNAEAAKADEHFKKTLDDCEKILTLDDKCAEAYFIRGVAAQYQGDWNAGIDAFTKCVELSPEYAEAYHRRGEIYEHTGDYGNASIDRKKAAELGYRDVDGGSATENDDASQTVAE